jgi:hypothetical protein
VTVCEARKEMTTDHTDNTDNTDKKMVVAGA